MANSGNGSIFEGLAGGIEGEVLSDAFSLGRYATDASIYQIEPLGVVIPKSENDIEATHQFARIRGFPYCRVAAERRNAGKQLADRLS